MNKKAEANRELSLHLMQKWRKSLFADVLAKGVMASFNDCFPLVCDGGRSMKLGGCKHEWLTEDIKRYL